MADFNSSQAKSKWQSLQNSAGASLSAVVQGRAQSSDFSRISTVLNGLNGLAAQVFSQAVSAADQQAKKFEAQYKKAGTGGTGGGDNLTAYEKALNDALSTIAPDIVSSLKEIIEMSALESNEDLTREMGGRFADLQQMLPPKDLPTVNDLLAANELLVEQLATSIKKDEDVAWEKRGDGLAAKVLSGFKSLIEQMAAHGSPARGNSSRSFGLPALPSPSHHDVIDMEPNVAEHALALVGGGGGHAVTDVMGSSEHGASTAVSSASLSQGKDGPTISMSPAAEKTIQQAATDQTNLYSKLLDFLQGGQKESKENEEEDEEKKADTWWRSFKNWSKDKSDKVKDFGKDNMGWLGALGSGLALAMLNPQIFKYFGDQIEKYLTWDNLKSAVSTAWDWVAKQGKDVIDWVLEKLHIGGGSTSKAELSKGSQAQVNAMTPSAELGGLGGPQTKAAYIMKMETKPGDPNSLSARGKQLLAAADPETKKAFEAMKYDNESGVQRVGRGLSEAGTSIRNFFGGSSNATPADASAGRSSITPTSTPAVGTTAVDATNVAMKPGIATTPPGVAPAGDAPAGTGDQRPIKGAPQMGSSSFGFHTGISDSLMMMNTPYFSG